MGVSLFSMIGSGCVLSVLLDYLHICLFLILIVAMVLHLRSLTSLNVIPEGNAHKHISPMLINTHICRHSLEVSSGESWNKDSPRGLSPQYLSWLPFSLYWLCCPQLPWSGNWWYQWGLHLWYFFLLSPVIEGDIFFNCPGLRESRVERERLPAIGIAVCLVEIVMPWNTICLACWLAPHRSVYL